MYIYQGGKTPLHYAAREGHEECVKIMLQLPDIAADIAAVVGTKERVSLSERSYVYIVDMFIS